MLFFDLAEPSQMIETVEPLFINLNASTEIVPVMNGDDLRKGLGISCRSSCGGFLWDGKRKRIQPSSLAQTADYAFG